MDRIRISYSILNAWASGDKKRAINGVLRLPTETTPAMENGKRVHKLISDSKAKLLPFIDDTFIYEDIDPDKGRWVNYFNIPMGVKGDNGIPDYTIDYSMVIDCYSPEKGIIIDWKTGKTKSSGHNKMQLYCYAYALEFEGVNITTGIIGKVNNDAELEDFTSCTIGDKERDKAREFIIKNTNEIIKIL
jgi:hypothetical protein